MNRNWKRQAALTLNHNADSGGAVSAHDRKSIQKSSRISRGDVGTNIVSKELPRFFLVERLHNGTFDRERIDAIGLMINNLSVRGDQHGIGHLALPVWVERVDQLLPRSGSKIKFLNDACFFFRNAS